MKREENFKDLNTDVTEFKSFYEALTINEPDYEPFLFPVRQNSKDPLIEKGKSWKDQQVTYDKALELLENGYNIGIAATDRDRLCIVDIDDMDIVGNFKPTLTDISRKRIGRHAYYFTDDKPTDDVFRDSAKRNIPLNDAGEVRANWQYVVAPGSFVPCDDEELSRIPEDDIENAGKYTVLDHRTPESITFEELPHVYKQKIYDDRQARIDIEAKKAFKKDKPNDKNKKNHSALWDLDINDIVPGHHRKTDRFEFSELHGSKTGSNMSISNGLLHCWRHLVSHNALTALATMAGIETCDRAGYSHNSGVPSYLDFQDGETVFEVWKYAKDHNYIPENDPIPTSALVYYALNNNYCNKEDVIDGWKLPVNVYNKIIEDADFETGRKPIHEHEKITKEHIKNKLDEHNLETFPSYIYEWANVLLTQGDTFRFIVDTWNRHHVGDRIIGEACACAVASTYMENSKGLHIKPSGDSGKGKSDGAKKFLHLLPENKKLCGSLSGKSMFYNPNLTKGTIIYTDDVQLNEDIVSTVKQAITNFQDDTVHNTVKKQEFQKYTIPERISWWMTSVSGFDDDQMGNRFLGVDVDSSPEQDQKVFEHQAMMERLGITDDIVDDDVMVCRAVFNILGIEDYKIVFPYTNCIIWNNKDNRRNFGMFMDILKSVAFYNVKQREKFHDVYLATIEDYKRAKEIYKGLAESNATNLTETELYIMRWLEGEYEVDIKDIAKHIKKSETSARNIMHGRDGRGGLLAKVSGLSSEKVNMKVTDDKHTMKTVYRYDCKLGINTYEDVVNIKEDCIEQEYKKFKEEYQQVINSGSHTLTGSHTALTSKCESPKSTTIDRITTSYIHTYTYNNNITTKCDSGNDSRAHTPNVIVKTGENVRAQNKESTVSDSGSHIGCESGVRVCESGESQPDLREITVSMSNFVKGAYPDNNVPQISDLVMDFAKSHPKYKKSHGYSDLKEIATKLSESGWEL